MLNLLARIIFVIAIFSFVIYGWWFVALIIGLIATWYFKYFIEFIFAGIILDSLYGYSDYLGIWAYSGAIISTLFFLLSAWLKGVLRR